MDKTPIYDAQNGETPSDTNTQAPVDSSAAPVADPPTAAASDANPNPFDPARFAAKGSFQGSLGVTKQLVSCPVRKPGKQEFVRVRQGEESRLQTYILELKEERETYLVDPAIAASLPGEVRLVELRVAVSRQGALFVWPVPVPKLDGPGSSWHTSARAAADKAETDWVRVVSNMPQGAYDVFVAPGALSEPEWPNNTMGDLLAVAFGERFTIRDINHPMLKRLQGLQ